ncbi:Kinetochore protein fta7 [Ceratocystis lukuohia]|uniref:Kinetochore protein fta7 n=1 Tax=Ceratocystis lukuohia TaxID=2019550 RepID=A0ABR4MFB1_9PEZI
MPLKPRSRGGRNRAKTIASPIENTSSHEPHRQTRSRRQRTSVESLEVPDKPVASKARLRKTRQQTRRETAGAQAQDETETASSSSRAKPRRAEKKQKQRESDQAHGPEGDSSLEHESPRNNNENSGLEEPAPPKRKRGRSSTTQAHNTTQLPTGTTSKRPRLSQSRPANDAAQSPQTSTLNPGAQALIDPVPRKYPHLAPRVRHIPRSVIEDKWSPLEASSQAAIKAVLHLAAQPALTRAGTNATRHKAGLAAIRAVSKRIQSKLSRGLPFPPASPGGVPVRGGPAMPRRRKDTDAGRADELDFEKTLAGVNVLEEGLDTLLHSVALLEKERDNLVRQIEKEHERAVKLEGDVKKEATMWKESLRKAHALTPGKAQQDSSSDDSDRAPRLFSTPDANVLPGEAFRNLDAEKGEVGEEVRDLARQVANHMESIRGNMAQIKGIIPQIGRTRAALQVVLTKNLDTKQVQTVMLG